ncbi:MAG: hypothetical protein B6242_04395 [Anaerolineaceae bacterium 4572_78]|nr:MAG: hypothetical protein B6242_04395 [Anaerolineaceae bacterium 4572_78]
MRSGNPVLSDNVFFDVQSSTDTMTIEGTVFKTGILIILATISASYVWSLFYAEQSVQGWMMGGVFGGLIVAMVTIFKKEWSPFTAPVYALLEGLFIGGFSALVQSQFPNIPIVIQAIALTFGVTLSLLVAYMSGLIKATENFKLGIVAATGGIFIIYFATFILSFFGINVPYIHEGGLIGIAFSLFVVVIAALNLVLDFDFIENGSKYGSPKYMEWYGAFGLMVTLVWLYIEILRLLVKIYSSDD